MNTKKNKKSTHSGTDRSDQSYGSDKKDKIECLEKLFYHSFRNFTLYSVSIEQFITRDKPSLRRRVVYHTNTFNLLIASLVYSYLFIHNNEDDIQYIGAPITLIFFTPYNRIAYVLCSITAFFVGLYRIGVIVWENYFRIRIDDLLLEINVRKTASKVNDNKNKYKNDLNSYYGFATPLNSEPLNIFSFVIIC